MRQGTRHIKKPELVSPAGDRPSLNAAVEAGADGVYFGVKGMNMRHSADNFHLNELPGIMSGLRESGTKGYLVLNTLMLQPDLARAAKIIQKAKAAQVDAVILWDPAVLKMAKDAGLRVHISTQAGAANAESVKFYADLGAEQVVLARECTLQDIRAVKRRLKQENISCAVETFIHGAMCVSVSGRCFLSQQTFAKSANQGKCLQPCRREYFIRDTEGECEYILGSDYVLSPRDLCALDFLEQLIEAGIDSFKIEGRMRSPEYVRVTTSCYRRAVDAFFKGDFTDDLKRQLRAELETVYNRGFSAGFFLGRPGDEAWSRGLQHTHEKVFAGEVTRFFKKISVAEVRLLSHGLRKGEEVLITGNKTPALKSLVEEMKRDDDFILSARKGETVGLKVPRAVRPKDKVFLWRRRSA